MPPGNEGDAIPTDLDLGVVPDERRALPWRPTRMSFADLKKVHALAADERRRLCPFVQTVFCDLSGESHDEIVRSSSLWRLLQRFRGLQDLKISAANKELTIANLKILIDNIGSCEHLTNLALIFPTNKVNGLELPTLATWSAARKVQGGIARLHQLKVLELNLADNEVNGMHLKDFGKALGHCSAIEVLIVNFSYNEILGKDVAQFLQPSASWPCLEKLDADFSSNSIGNDHLGDIAKRIRSFTQLRSLRVDFSRGEITDEGLKQFANGLGVSNAITTLDLNFAENLQLKKDFGVSALAELLRPGAFDACRVDLRGTRITQEGAEQIRNACAIMDLIVDEGLRTTPPSWSTAPSQRSSDSGPSLQRISDDSSTSPGNASDDGSAAESAVQW
mmetsp:Transcript_140025/g.314416  ORF Transcript_140025/g.314416 Transcript_140025/m.314416 type:complete len:392 (+) Transcript_140025:53-1228(+)